MRDLHTYALILLVLAVLPGCGQLLGTTDPEPPSATSPDLGNNLINGSYPRSGVVFCDIEKFQGRRCATPQDRARGLPLDRAAIALHTGARYDFALDFSAEATGQCNGEPQVVEFQNLFPDGTPVCVNCGDVLGPGKPYPDPDALCRAKCLDFFQGLPDANGNTKPTNPPTSLMLSFCGKAARASTNSVVATFGCFANTCNDLDTDKRRLPEPVIWTDHIGTTAAGAAANDLTRTADTTGAFDAGAASTQWITTGDGFVEFGVAQNHYVGVTPIPEGCAAPCPDTKGDSASIGFALYIDNVGGVYISEGGQLVQNGISFGTAALGERFRVGVVSNRDGTANIIYSKLAGPCFPGAPCNVTVLHVSTAVPKYPFRVDTSLRDKTETITNVNLVRIR